MSILGGSAQTIPRGTVPAALQPAAPSAPEPAWAAFIPAALRSPQRVPARGSHVRVPPHWPRRPPPVSLAVRVAPLGRGPFTSSVHGFIPLLPSCGWGRARVVGARRCAFSGVSSQRCLQSRGCGLRRPGARFQSADTIAETFCPTGVMKILYHTLHSDPGPAWRGFCIWYRMCAPDLVRAWAVLRPRLLRTPSPVLSSGSLSSDLVFGLLCLPCVLSWPRRCGRCGPGRALS